MSDRLESKKLRRINLFGSRIGDAAYHHTTNQMLIETSHQVKTGPNKGDKQGKSHANGAADGTKKIRDTLPSRRRGRERCRDGEEV